MYTFPCGAVNLYTIPMFADDCLATEHPEKCTHKVHEMPRWLSSQKMETVKALLSEDPAMLLRESMGVSADGSNKAFASADVDRLINRPRQAIPIDYHMPGGPSAFGTSHFIIAVDPCGGGASAFAITSMAQVHTGHLLLLGVDLLHTRDVKNTHILVIEHIAAVRRIKGLEEATVVLCLESNLAYESQHILHAIQAAGVRKWVALAEGQGGSLGWLTTHERKEAMCLQTREALRTGNMHICDGFFSVKMEEREALKQIRDELCRFSIVVEPAKTLFGKIRKTYTGKLGGLQDDLSITIQLAVSAIRCFYQNEKYQNFRSEY